jgi:hypothetical protein
MRCIPGVEVMDKGSGQADGLESVRQRGFAVWPASIDAVLTDIFCAVWRLLLDRPTRQQDEPAQRNLPDGFSRGAGHGAVQVA